METSLVGKRIVIVTGALPPSFGGVADHSGLLIKHFSQAGAEISILSSSDQVEGDKPKKGNGAGAKWLRPASRGWKMGEVSEWADTIVATRPDFVWVQWVPFLYERRGMNISIPLLVRALKRHQARVITLSHELWVPMNRLAFFISGPIQRWALRTLIENSEKTFVSTQPWVELLKNRFLAHADRIGWLPSASNVEVIPIENAEVKKIRSQLSSSEKSVLIAMFCPFGYGRPAEWLAQMVKECEVFPDIRYVMVGVTEEEIKKNLSVSSIPRNVVALGKIPLAEISRVLSSCDVGLAFFVDGISARRTSALAMLSHGLPTLTNVGASTDRCFLEAYPQNWTRGLDNLPSSQEVKGWIDQILQTRDHSRRQTRMFYDAYLSWSRVMDQVASVMS